MSNFHFSTLLALSERLGGVVNKAATVSTEVSFSEGHRAPSAASSCLPAHNGRKSRKLGGLGTTTNFGAANDETGLNYGENHKKARYQLAEKAKELLPNSRLTFCMHSLTAVKVNQDIETGSAHLSGVAHCGLGWVCPVCGSKIAMGRRTDLQSASQAATEQGLQAYFVTYTAAHSREDKLADNLQDMKTAIRSMRQSRAWRNFKKNHGVVGYVDAWEITWGQANGWHAHMHEVIFASPGGNPLEMQDEIYKQWENSLSKLGLSSSEAHGVAVIEADDDIGNYLTKWSLQAELTGQPFKHGKTRKSHTPMGLLGLAEQGEKWAGKLFQEYAMATRGKSAIRWSRGLRDRLGVGLQATDQELADHEQEREVREIAIFPTEIWARVIRHHRRGIIGELLVVAGLGRDALDAWLYAVFGLGIGSDGVVKGKKCIQDLMI
jgi:hypothetical protein